jgi:5-methylcytosine-specific restriction enzyme subunit McrC
MIQVREYALLTSVKSISPSMDVGIVSQATIDWIIELQKTWLKDSSAAQLQNKSTIKLGSYVGYLESPAGEAIEILPKFEQTELNQTELVHSRKLLVRMLLSNLNLKPREVGIAHLQLMDTPIHEWIIKQFLASLSLLVKRGLRFDYININEESRFIRGRLDLARQSRQPIDRATWFHISHDIFSPNRIENRLIKTALGYALKVTKEAENWRLANELNHYLSDIDIVKEPNRCLSQWKSGKLMNSYAAIKPWCELLLAKMNPNFQQGESKGISLLFPMESLFEGYVYKALRKQACKSTRLEAQRSSQYLVKHQPVGSANNQNFFQLRPDILLSGNFGVSVMDSKWKLLNTSQNSSKNKYGLSQSDFYQLFAYGHTYMSGQGHMMLIYPKYKKFKKPLPVFSFDDKLHLWIVPFDLDNEFLVGGDWLNHFPAFRDHCDDAQSA